MFHNLVDSAGLKMPSNDTAFRCTGFLLTLRIHNLFQFWIDWKLFGQQSFRNNYCATVWRTQLESNQYKQVCNLPHSLSDMRPLRPVTWAIRGYRLNYDWLRVCSRYTVLGSEHLNVSCSLRWLYGVIGASFSSTPFSSLAGVSRKPLYRWTNLLTLTMCSGTFQS